MNVETYNMSQVLSLICTACGRRFASALQMEPRTFESIRMNSHLEWCRVCGRAIHYSKADYLFIDDKEEKRTDPLRPPPLPPRL